jgi:acetyl esterase/lipase
MRLLSLLILASAAFGQDYRTVENVQYCAGGGKPLLMDVFLPAIPARNPTPAVLWLHGGGWKRGDKNGSSGALLLAGAGFVTASLYYRLSGGAKFPAQIEDVKCAIRYLRSHAADYGIDPDSIGVAGADVPRRQRSTRAAYAIRADAGRAAARGGGRAANNSRQCRS